MGDNRKQPREGEEVAAFFNRGRHYAIEILKDNEQLRSKIRRLEQIVRGTRETGQPRGPGEGGSTDER